MDRTRYQQWRAVGMIVMATVMWSLMAPVGKALFSAGVDPLMVVTVRTVVGGLVLALGLRLVRGTWARASRSDFWLLAGYGVCIAGNYLAYFKSIEVGTVTVAAVVLHIYPAFVVIGARVFHGEPLTVRRWLAFLMAAVGIVLLTEVGNADAFVVHAAGALWGLVSALFLAGHVLLAKELVKRCDPFTTVQFGLLIAAGCLVIPCVIWGSMVNLNLLIAGLLAVLVLVCTIGAYCLFTKAIEELPVGRSGIITLLEMVWVMAWGRFLLGEITTPLQLMGVVFVLAGVVLAIGEQRSQMMGAELEGG